MDGNKVNCVGKCCIWGAVEIIDLFEISFVLFTVESSELEVSSMTSNVGHDGEDDCDGLKGTVKIKNKVDISAV